MITWVADFETIVKPDKTRIWAWFACEVGNVDNFIYGTTMEEFITWCKKENKILYFHNLKFDSEFIYYHLLTEMGFSYSPKKLSNTFNCVISNMGQSYKLEIIFSKFKKRYNKVEIYDSHKKLPFSVDTLADAFHLPIKKIKVPKGYYELDRPVGYQLNEFDILYGKHDVQVVAMCLGIQFEQELTKMTIGSDALNNFKKILGNGDKKIGNINFERLFPVLPLPVHFDIQHAYKGGYVYVKPEHAGQDLETIKVYDVNSLYPWVMRTQLLPYDMPIFFTDKYQDDEFYPLFIQKLTCSFTLKPGHLPTIQIKHGGRYTSTEYLTTSLDKDGLDDEVELCLTNVDLALFFEHYDVEVISWDGGWMYKGARGLFDEYIDYWMGVKIQAEKDGNKAMRTLAKLMLNSLYGKFAKNPDVTGKYPEIDEDTGAVHYVLDDEKLDNPIYLPMGAFITAYAREKTIRTGQMEYDRFVYADTDSLHLLGYDKPSIEVHGSDLGAWKHEGDFSRARFVRAKTYIEQDEKGLHVTCAGMPDNVKKLVTWENFRVVNEDMLLPARDGYFYGKLFPDHVPGGIVLKPGYFTIS